MLTESDLEDDKDPEFQGPTKKPQDPVMSSVGKRRRGRPKRSDDTNTTPAKKIKVEKPAMEKQEKEQDKNEADKTKDVKEVESKSKQEEPKEKEDELKENQQEPKTTEKEPNKR